MNTLSYYVLDDNPDIPHVVYALVDPRDHLPFYVGITDDLYQRFREHISLKETNIQKNDRIRELQQAYLLPIMQTLEVTESYAKARQRENHWIRHYLSEGIELLNMYVPLEEKSSAVKHVGRTGTADRTRQLVLYRLEWGVWPEDLAYDMGSYYEVRYIRENGKYHDKTVKWWNEYSKPVGPMARRDLLNWLENEHPDRMPPLFDSKEGALSALTDSKKSVSNSEETESHHA